MPHWHRGHLVLVGDAAHAASPSSGQGASMAMEDAVTLARCLRDISDVPAAFTAYERLRRRRVERVVARGRRSGSQKAPGPVGRVLRDAALRLIFARRRETVPASQRWLFEHRVDWDTPVTPPVAG